MISHLSLRCLAICVLLLQYGVSSQNTFIEVAKHDGKISGLVCQYGTIAIAAGTRVHLYRDVDGENLKKTSRDKLIGTIELSDQIDDGGELLEFQLTDYQSILYCNVVTCRICALGSDCTELKRDSKYIKTKVGAAKAVIVHSKVFIKFTENGKENKAWTSVYRLDKGQNSQYIEPSQTTEDLQYVTETALTSAWSTEGYAYFLGSSKNFYEPARLVLGGSVPSSSAKKYTFGSLRATRICVQDDTPNLDSRIEMTLSCGQIKEQGGDAFVMASRQVFQDGIPYIYAVVHDVSNETIPVHVCRFNVQELEAKMENTWNICQQVDKRQIKDDCEQRLVESEGPYPDFCYIYTRNDGSRICSRFEGRTYNGTPHSNCEVSSHLSTAYRYGTLLNYKPFEGEVVATFLYKDVKMVSDFVYDHTNSLTAANTEGYLMRLPPMLKGGRPSWKKKISSTSIYVTQSEHQPLVYYGTGDKEDLLGNDKLRVRSQLLSCSALFNTCDDLMNVGYNDTLQCGYCPKPDGFPGGSVHSRSEKFACQDRPLLVNMCPPSIASIDFDKSQNTFNLHGSHFNSMMRPTVTVCGNQCDLQMDDRDDTMMCHLADADSTTAPDQCTVEINGILDTHPYTFRRMPDSFAQTSGSSSGEKGKGMSRAAKGVIGFFSILAVIVVLVFIIWCARRKYMVPKKPNDGQNASIIFDGGHYNRVFRRAGDTHERRPLNPYREHAHHTTVPMDDFSPYQQIAQEIDPKLKIDMDTLTLSTLLGHGHFGNVFKATYLPSPYTQSREVACKMLRAGVSGVGEFVSEGVTMSRFNHPRVMRLIGIAFAEDFAPIIVTEYMHNGDLHKYLRDPTHTLTLRQLLQFGLQIAEGMEYLHSLKFIHRDLAARNCMLDKELNIKIADFGLCRELINYENYEVLHKHRDLPLRWIPIEAFEVETQTFTFKGDVWAYGVVLWELMTRGQLPYTQVPAILLRQYVAAGNRLAKPEYCPISFYNRVMYPCWDVDPSVRPSFTEIITLVKQVVHELEQSQLTQMNSHYEPPVSSLKTGSSSNGFTPVTQVTGFSTGEPRPEDGASPGDKFF